MLQTILLGSLLQTLNISEVRLLDDLETVDSGYLKVIRPDIDYRAFILEKGGVICIVENNLYTLEPSVMAPSFNPKLSVHEMIGTDVYPPHTVFNPDQPETLKEKIFLSTFEDNKCLNPTPKDHLYVNGILTPAEKVGK